MPWRLPRWAAITFPVAVTLKRFLAPDLVFSLGIWLSCCRAHLASRETQWPAKMLARALKVRDYFSNETIRTGIDTAALNQPGDEGCAYGRAAQDWQRLTRIDVAQTKFSNTAKMECIMTKRARMSVFVAEPRCVGAMVVIFVAALLAAVVALPRGAVARGAYDGTWNVTFTPRQGN